jgi:hypothetical protein
VLEGRYSREVGGRGKMGVAGAQVGVRKWLACCRKSAPSS